MDKFDSFLNSVKNHIQNNFYINQAKVYTKEKSLQSILYINNKGEEFVRFIINSDLHKYSLKIVEQSQEKKNIKLSENNKNSIISYNLRWGSVTGMTFLFIF